MSRHVPVLAALLFLAGCRAEPTQEPEAQSEAASAGEASGPTLWLEAEHFDPPEPTAPAEPVASPLEGFSGVPIAEQHEPDGLAWSDYASGEGPAAGHGAKLRFDYVGTLTDGSVFDSTYERNLPFDYELGKNMVIPGLERGLVGVRAGMRRKITIPPALGYGSTPRASIPENSVLIFHVVVLSVN